MPQVRPKKVTEQSLPPLLVGRHHTTSSALHEEVFFGPLYEWKNFREIVEENHKRNQWSNKTVYRAPQSGEDEQEEVFVGDEHGVQGRFQQWIGHTMGKVLAAEGLNLRFADFKSVQATTKSIPDVILKNNTDELKVAGELKVPWVAAHYLGYPGLKRTRLRQLLGQPTRYMRELQSKYGFISTYDETIFLQQCLVNGEWRVEHSPVIHSTDSYIPAGLKRRCLKSMTTDPP